VKVLTVGKKGYDQLKRDMADLFIEDRRVSPSKAVGYAQAEEVSAKIITCSRLASSMSHADTMRLQNR
jgi:F-type H+-transporting ATPase subunit gamma